MRAKVLHLKHLRHLTFALFLLANSHHVVTLSAFWDTDILILAIFVLYEFKHRIAIDSVWLGTIELTEEHCLTLIRIHAFKGNDYMWSFFKGGKEKILEDYWEISTILNLPQNVSYQPRTTCVSLWAGARTVCSVSGAKIKSFFTSFQTGPSVSCQPSKLDCVYQICGGNWVQPIVPYETMGGFLTLRYFQWMRPFQ